MTMKKKIIEQIKKDCCKPVPRWLFVARGISLYIIFVMLFLLASLFASLMFYYLAVNDWALYSELSRPLHHKIIATMPFMLLGFLAALIYLVYVDLRKQDVGYRHCTWTVMIVIVAGVFISGGIVHMFDGGHKLDRYAMKKYPKVAGVINPRMNPLSKPESGVLFGVVKTEVESGNFELHNMKHGTWMIILPNADTSTLEIIQIGNHLRAVGEVQTEKVFKAAQVLPFHRDVLKRAQPLKRVNERKENFIRSTEWAR